MNGTFTYGTGRSAGLLSSIGKLFRHSYICMYIKVSRNRVLYFLVTAVIM